MSESKKLFCNFSLVVFILLSFSFVLERNDFFGEILDKNQVKKVIKEEDSFKKSIFSTNKSLKSQFRRFDLSALIAIPKLNKEISKFEIVKKHKAQENNALVRARIMFWMFILASIISAILVFRKKSSWLILSLDTVLFLILILYNQALKKGLASLGLKKSIYESWGVAESVQHLLIFSIFICMLAIIIYHAIKEDTESLGLFVEAKDEIKETKIKIKNFKYFKDAKFAYYMLAPAVIVVILIIIYPFLYNFRISFSSLNLKRFSSFITGNKLYFNGIQNYIEIFGNSVFWTTLGRTIIWTTTNIVFHVVGGVTIAILLNRKMKLRPIYQVILILPWAIPQFIAVLVWRGMFNSRYGAVNLFLTEFVQKFIPWAKVEIPWLTDPFWLFTGAIITNVWLGIPFMMMIALGGLQSIPETYYEAADIDGASAWQKIVNITIPQLKPVMTPAIIMGIVWTFNNLNVIYLLSTDTLTGKVDILVTYVYKAAFNLYRYGYAAAFSAVIFAILMMFSVLMIKSTKVEEGVR